MPLGNLRGCLLVLALGASAGLAGCSSDAPTNPSTPTPAERPAASRDRERTTVSALARSVALALRDPAVRQKLKNDLRESRFTREHKLELATYVHGGGATLLNSMVRAAGETPAAVNDRLRSVRSLEIYFPVPAQRESWTGGDDLIVAAQLSDGDEPVGYRLNGTPVELTLDHAPATPTLVIVGAETDFRHPLGHEWVNRADAKGDAIGSYVRVASRPNGMMADPCADPTLLDDPSVCQEPTSPPPATYPSGLYISHTNIPDLKESWPRGDPELEVFLIGPTANPDNDGEKLSCSGQGAGGYKHFDQNSQYYSAPYWSVEAQLYTRAELDNYATVYNKPFEVQFWEDDQDACEIVTDQRSQLQQLVDNLTAVYQISAIVVHMWETRTITAGAINAIRGRLAATWENNDDFVGLARVTPGTNPYPTGADAVLELPGGGTNGSVSFITY
jgi:hypothetical protein